MAKSLFLCRALYRELKMSCPELEVRGSQLWRYVVGEVRKVSPLDEQSVGGGRIAVLGEYVEYLKSSREHRDLLSQYQGRGERSTEESARLVGLELPQNTFK